MLGNVSMKLLKQSVAVSTCGNYVTLILAVLLAHFFACFSVLLRLTILTNASTIAFMASRVSGCMASHSDCLMMKHVSFSVPPFFLSPLRACFRTLGICFE